MEYTFRTHTEAKEALSILLGSRNLGYKFKDGECPKCGSQAKLVRGINADWKKEVVAVCKWCNSDNLQIEDE